MELFLNTQHKLDFEYLMNCHSRYTNEIPLNEWSSTSYIIAGMNLNDAFLSILKPDLTIDTRKLQLFSSMLNAKEQLFLRYALQQSYHFAFQNIQLDSVLKNSTTNELHLLINACDTNYFQKS